MELMPVNGVVATGDDQKWKLEVEKLLAQLVAGQNALNSRK